MYNQYFGFSEAPFSISPDPHYLFMSERHREALAHLRYGLRIDGGFVLLTGEAGTGKTTLCRYLLAQMPEHCDIAFIFNPRLSRLELLKTLCEGLHILVPGNACDLKTLLDRLNAHLLEGNARGRKTLLIVDEAQKLSAEVLELLRLLIERHERLQIILLGQTELRDIRDREDMRQFAQHIVTHYHLEPLSCQEVGAYIQHRLAVAGTRAMLFAPPLLESLYRLSGGRPRLINVLCDRALYTAYVQGKTAVDRAALESAAREVLGPTHRTKPPSALAAILGISLLAGLAVASWQLAPDAVSPQTEGTPSSPSSPSPTPETTAPDKSDEPLQPTPASPAEENDPPLEPPRPEPLEPPEEDIADFTAEDHWLHESQALPPLPGRPS